MSKELEVSYYCDLAEDREPAVIGDVAINIGGDWYQVDLGESAYKAISELREAVKVRGRYCESAPDVPGGRVLGGPEHIVTPRPDSKNQVRMARRVHGKRVRDWCNENGRPIGTTGVIPPEYVNAYNDAHPDDQYTYAKAGSKS